MFPVIFAVILLSCGASPPVQGAEFRFVQSENSLELFFGDKPVGTYVWRDPSILRPFFMNLRTPSGIQVTRMHPPKEGVDSTDHASMHPGLWLGFGNISGADFWRNKGRVEHLQFIEKPATNHSSGFFAVRNRYLAGEKVICEQICRYSFRRLKNSYLATVDTTFIPIGAEIYFQSQEEMGLGIRMATPLAVKNGGTMLDSEGRKNEGQIWGNGARWLDYHGILHGQKVGVTLIPHPNSIRPCWFHARDYGVMVANPFEREDLHKGNPPRIIVKHGETLTLRFGVLLHEGDFDPNSACDEYLKASGSP